MSMCLTASAPGDLKWWREERWGQKMCFPSDLSLFSSFETGNVRDLWSLESGCCPVTLRAGQWTGGLLADAYLGPWRCSFVHLLSFC